MTVTHFCEKQSMVSSETNVVFLLKSFFDLSHDLSHFFAYFDVLMTYDVATKKSLTLTLMFDVSQRKNDNFSSKSIKIMTTLYFFVVC